MPIAKGQKIEAKYDGEKLYGLIKAGSNEAQIMAELGIQSKPTLKNHLLKLMQEKKGILGNCWLVDPHQKQLPGLSRRQDRADR